MLVHAHIYKSSSFIAEMKCQGNLTYRGKNSLTKRAITGGINDYKQKIRNITLPTPIQ